MVECGVVSAPQWLRRWPSDAESGAAVWRTAGRFRVRASTPARPAAPLVLGLGFDASRRAQGEHIDPRASRGVRLLPQGHPAGRPGRELCALVEAAHLTRARERVSVEHTQLGCRDCHARLTGEGAGPLEGGGSRAA